MKRLFILLFAVAIIGAFLTVPGMALASDKTDAQAIVTKANITFNSFMTDNNFTEMRKLSRSAKGIFIAPQVLKGAFIWGASGGTGVLLVREEGGKFTQPAFYTIGSVSFGLQIGGQASEIILLAMTDRGVTTLLQNSVKLGADVGIAAGPYGAGAQAATANISADILTFSRSKGLYGGISLDGAIVDVRDSLNKAYYNKPVTPTDILVKKNVFNAHADKLRASVAKISGGK
ncbi:MAG TPA: lipid-binding SYLF domain-containing protein [Syntrophales bacterium]